MTVKFVTKKIVLLWIILPVLALKAGLITAAGDDLPQMGEPVDQNLSPAAEQKVGEQFYKAAKAQLPLVQDIELREYLQHLGERLLSGVKDLGQRKFTFFLIDDDSINAFAVPGGYIGINTGLVRAFETEGQLAAVIAHEIAHITQRHHARAYAAQGNTGLTTAAAILAAILIGRESPQAGQAALATGLAVSTQNQINYTRTNEYEADRIGIDILSRSGFTASSMAKSFAILRKNNFLNTASNQIEYLRTHPLGDNRVAEAKNRAAQIGISGNEDSLSFQLFKMRLNVLTNSNTVSLRQALTATDPDQNSLPNQYGISLIDMISDHTDKAMTRRAQIVQKEDGNLFIRLMDAQLEYDAGDEKKAQILFDEIFDLYPTRFSPVKYNTDRLISKGNHRQAYEITSKYVRGNTQIAPDAYRLLANIMKKMGNKTESHEYLASYYKENGQYDKYIQQLEFALASAQDNSQAKLRIKAKLSHKNIE